MKKAEIKEVNNGYILYFTDHKEIRSYVVRYLDEFEVLIKLADFLFDKKIKINTGV